MKKTFIVILLILTLCASLFLFLHSRDSPKININTASVEAIESLPGIGEVLAERIILGRPFDDLYQLDKVRGIGPKTIEKILDKAVAE